MAEHVLYMDMARGLHDLSKYEEEACRSWSSVEKDEDILFDGGLRRLLT
jgi:hypothetical protein